MPRGWSRTGGELTPFEAEPALPLTGARSSAPAAATQTPECESHGQQQQQQPWREGSLLRNRPFPHDRSGPVEVSSARVNLLYAPRREADPVDGALGIVGEVVDCCVQ